MDRLGDISVFVCVAECASFTRAADKLDLSRSLVSKQVTQLEDRLQARLLHRTTRRVSLTEVGKVFYERARLGLQEIEDAENTVAQLQAQPRGVLKLNTPMSFGILHIAPRLNDFMSRYPELTIDMHLDDRKVDVIEEGFDLSIRITDLPDSSLIARRLAPCRHVIVASPAYLDQYGTPQTPAQLAENHRIITYRHQASAQEWHFKDRKGTVLTVSVPSHLQMNNSLALREALLGGAGIARMPTFAVGEEIRTSKLLPLLSRFSSPEVSIFAVYPQRRHLSPKVRTFIDFLATIFTIDPYWDKPIQG